MLILSGHCRRRKIRCLLAPDDPQGRCSNCIRLKKECNFFPVEQQPPTDQRTSLLAKGEPGSAARSTSTTSSPQASSSSAQDLAEDPHRFQHPLKSHTFPNATTSDGIHAVHFPSGGEMRRVFVALDDANPAAVAPPPPQTAAFPPAHVPPQGQWTPYSFGHATGSIEDLRTGTSSPGYWRPVESPTTYSNPSMAPAPPAGVLASQRLPYAQGREDLPWTAPMRSLSYGNLENLEQRQPVNQWQPPSGYSSRPPSYPYPPPLDTRSSSVTTLSEAVTTPVTGPLPASAGTQNFSPFSTTYQQQWSPYSAQHPPAPTIPSHSQETFNNHWYNESAKAGDENQPSAQYQTAPFYQGPYNPG